MAIILNRRGFIVTTAALGAAAGMTGRGFAQGGPVRGGVLTAKLSGDPSSFDVVSSTSSLTLNVIGPCYNSLLMFDPLSPEKVIGDLATAWREEEGGRRYVFTITDKARFHDGVPLTSEDVRYSFDLMRDPPEGKSSSRRDQLAVIEAISAPDPVTVVFDLAHPSPSFLGTLATGWMLVMPKHVLEANGNSLDEKVVGSGPFRLAGATRGVSYQLERNPDYHVPGRPYLDGITLYVVPDIASVYANFRTGQLLYWDNMEGSDAHRLRKEVGGALVQQATALSTEGISVNATRAPFDNSAVREAISLAISRPDAIRTILGGDGIVGGLMPPGEWELPSERLSQVSGYGPDVEANRARARELLAKAGFADGFETVITARKAGIHEARAVFAQDQLARIGIRASIDMQESAAYFDNLEARNFAILTDGLGAGLNDPDAFFGDFYTCAGTRNQSGTCNPEIDAIYARQREEADPAKRRAEVAQMEVAALSQFGWIGFYWKTRFMATAASVQGMVLHPQPDNARRLQDVWISS